MSWSSHMIFHLPRIFPTSSFNTLSSPRQLASLRSPFNQLPQTPFCCRPGLQLKVLPECSQSRTTSRSRAVWCFSQFQQILHLSTQQLGVLQVNSVFTLPQRSGPIGKSSVSLEPPPPHRCQTWPKPPVASCTSHWLAAGLGSPWLPPQAQYLTRMTQKTQESILHTIIGLWWRIQTQGLPDGELLRARRGWGGIGCTHRVSVPPIGAPGPTFPAKTGKLSETCCLRVSTEVSLSRHDW